MPIRRLAEWWKAKKCAREAAVEGTTAHAASAKSHDLPKHFGELWEVIQGIAREEDPFFADRPVMQHAAESVEGK